MLATPATLASALALTLASGCNLSLLKGDLKLLYDLLQLRGQTNWQTARREWTIEEGTSQMLLQAVDTRYICICIFILYLVTTLDAGM